MTWFEVIFRHDFQETQQQGNGISPLYPQYSALCNSVCCYWPSILSITDTRLQSTDTKTVPIRTSFYVPSPAGPRRRKNGVSANYKSANATESVSTATSQTSICGTAIKSHRAKETPSKH